MSIKKLSEIFLPSYIFSELLILGFVLMGFAWNWNYTWHFLVVVIALSIYVPIRFLLIKKKRKLEENYPSGHLRRKVLWTPPMVIIVYIVVLLLGLYNNIFELQFLIGVVAILIICLLVYGYILSSIFVKNLDI